MPWNKIYQIYQELQRYVGWTDDDARRVEAVAKLIEPHIGALIDDFYEEIDRHPEARNVITGGAEQVARLKQTLRGWLRDLVAGRYDKDYVSRRWRVGLRHVEIGLSQVFTNAALSRLRRGLLDTLERVWIGDLKELLKTQRSLNLLLDLDLAIIEDAYQTEFSQRQLAEGKARSDAAFRTLVEAAPALTIILRMDGTILYVNPFAERLIGYPTDEILGRDFARAFGDSPARQNLIKGARQGKPAHGIQDTVHGKNAACRSVVWNAELLSDFDGAPAILAIGHDVTEVNEAQQKALQAERLAAIGQMMTGLTHESRNALQRSKACLEMLALEVEDRPAALDLVRRIERAQEHVQHLYEEVRTYAAPINLKHELCDLRELWRETWSHLVQLGPEKKVELIEEPVSGKLACRVDTFAIGQVFRNILENAVSAVPDAGRITVLATATDLDGRPAVRIAFRDNGPGLSAEQRQRIFEPFYTTKTKGTGLGMAIAKRIVQSHGGLLEVSDSPGPGAEIIVTLPRETE